jgi:hypothetical protein
LNFEASADPQLRFIDRALCCPYIHLAAPRRTASTAANAVVTQIMFRRFDVTRTGKVLDAFGVFNGLTFLRGLISYRITGSLFVMAVQQQGALALGVPESFAAFPDGSWCPVSATSQIGLTLPLGLNPV